MNALGVIGMVVMFSGLICGDVAGVLYEPPIQRYLEKLGKKPAHLLAIGGAIDNYFNAKELAKRWGHHPPFLKRYGRMLTISLSLIAVEALVALLSWLYAYESRPN